MKNQLLALDVCLSDAFA
ncbi:DUF645 family protein [Vibrio cholerae]|nr:DUF645 family protein [Vibrio cholerae]